MQTKVKAFEQNFKEKHWFVIGTSSSNWQRLKEIYGSVEAAVENVQCICGHRIGSQIHLTTNEVESDKNETQT